MIQMKWVRVEHLPDGSLGKVEEVECKGRNGSVFRYYEAVDLADACRQAKEWHSSDLRKRADRAARRRNRLTGSGLCSQCGKNPLVSTLYCAECRDKHNARKRARREGRAPAWARNTPQEAIAKAKLHSDRSAKLAIEMFGSGAGYRYSLILRKLDELSPGEAPAFRAWLVSKIPAMQQDAWHPPLVLPEPMAEAAE